MVRYLLLAYRDEQRWETLPASERATFAEACFTSEQTLQESGYLLASADLQSNNAAVVRVQHGKVSLSDGPLARTDEQLAGIFFIDAKDLNEAIQIAARMPQARRGPIEVRLVIV